MPECSDARPQVEDEDDGLEAQVDGLEQEMDGLRADLGALTRARILGERTAEELEAFGYNEDPQTLDMLTMARRMTTEDRRAILTFIHALTCRDCTSEADADRWWERDAPTGRSAALADLRAFMAWAEESGTWECWYDQVEAIAAARAKELRRRAAS